VTGKILRFEWARWRGRRESIATVVFLLGGTIGYGVLLRIVADTDLAPGPVAALLGAEATGYLLAYQCARALLRVLGLFLLIWSATAVAGEIDKGTLRLALLRVPRTAVPLGKAAFLSLLSVALAGAVLLLSLALGALSYGLAPVDAGAVTLQTRMGLLGAGVAATGLTLLPLLALLALGVCVSCFARSAQGALTLTLLIGLLLWGGSLAPTVGGFLFPATFHWPFDVALSKAEGLKTLAFSDRLLSHCVVNVVWIVSLLAIGVARFGRRDLPA
jgi:ABC-type transport system involved in multi-copper enzyme maturation permease subunit